MKDIKSMTLGEFAAFVCSHLKENGINVVLSGGACVSIYTKNKYTSYDLDFIENVSSPRLKIKKIMERLGFREENRYFIHPNSEFFIEFPSGPLSVGYEPVKDIVVLNFPTGTLDILSPTDCVKDRLAAFYHWKDIQSLEQAVWVAEKNAIDLDEIERWSKKEGMLEKFLEIESRFKKK